MRKQKTEVRQIAKGVTLTGGKSVEWWDEQLRKEVAARREAEMTKDVAFTPDFQLTAKPAK